MTVEQLNHLKELAAAGKTREDIKTELLASGVSASDLDEALDIFVASSPRPAATAVPVPPTTYGASGSEAAYAEHAKEKGHQIRKRIGIIVAVVIGCLILGSAGVVGYAAWRVQSDAGNFANTIQQLQVPLSSGFQIATTDCYTVAVPANLTLKHGASCEIAAERSQPSQPPTTLVVLRQPQAMGPYAPAVFTQRIVAASKVLSYVVALRGGCVNHPDQIAPTVERVYYACKSTDGTVLTTVGYNLFGASGVTIVLGVSSSLEDNPAPAAYASLRLTD